MCDIEHFIEFEPADGKVMLQVYKRYRDVRQRRPGPSTKTVYAYVPVNVVDELLKKHGVVDHLELLEVNPDSDGARPHILPLL